MPSGIRGRPKIPPVSSPSRTRRLSSTVRRAAVAARRSSVDALHMGAYHCEVAICCVFGRLGVVGSRGSAEQEEGRHDGSNRSNGLLPCDR